ncbi:MAG: hypothetical protein JWO90_2524, partial [Solirubrobacterales bacterium]|nr:hypothetical protein [Solirubrobacterales bacterium]
MSAVAAQAGWVAVGAAADVPELEGRSVEV